MKKDDLVKRIAQFDLDVNQVQFQINQLMAKHASIIGAREEAQFWLNELEKPADQQDAA